MAPRGRGRGRSKKIGNTRMDVAMDAMREFGFPPALVRQSVKHLLNVYGGDDCWVFIERDSYKVLIDFILDTHSHSQIDDGSEMDALMDSAEAALPLPPPLDSHPDTILALEFGTATAASEEKPRTVRYENGWIRNDNDYDHNHNDLVYLTPEPLTQALLKMLNPGL